MIPTYLALHQAAMASPKAGHEAAMVKLIEGFRDYRQAHFERFESPIGEDCVLGSDWEAIGRGILGLLNGETGRLDCGTIDGQIRMSLDEEGFKAE